MRCLAVPRAPMSGLLDDILSPRQAADEWMTSQRQAVAGDLAYQRAALESQMRQVASDATTDAAIKFAIAGAAAFGFGVLVWKLATRSR
jgi:hypothetical protein